MTANLGYDFVGTELDKDYYDAAVERFNKHKAQGQLFMGAGDSYDKVDRDYQEILI